MKKGEGTPWRWNQKAGSNSRGDDGVGLTQSSHLSPGEKDLPSHAVEKLNSASHSR